MKPAWVLMIALSACGVSVSHTMINAPLRPLEPGGLVDIYASSAPTRAHQDVALFNVEQSSGYSTADAHDMLLELRKDAGLLGCDGVVLMGKTIHGQGNGIIVEERSSGVLAVDGLVAVAELVSLWSHERVEFTATCFIWTGPPEPSVVTTGPPPVEAAARPREAQTAPPAP
jgi:hypothetical protein